MVEKEIVEKEVKGSDENTEKFLLDDKGLNLGEEQFLLNKKGFSPESIIPERRKRGRIVGIFGYLIFLAIFGVVAYSFSEKISTVFIAVGAVLVVSIIIFIIYKKRKKPSETKVNI
tara:strand:+ start:206 stop:553 length:348 start_codon:yes stop_codon:yes gene_type:complete